MLQTFLIVNDNVHFPGIDIELGDGGIPRQEPPWINRARATLAVFRTAALLKAAMALHEQIVFLAGGSSVIDEDLEVGEPLAALRGAIFQATG